MEIDTIINKLTALGGRIGRQEAAAAELLCSMLDAQSVRYSVQNFDSTTPKYQKASLIVDGAEVGCLTNGLKSGEITSNYNLISSLTDPMSFLDTPNINFNPRSDAICLCNFYHAPALAISRLDVPKVMNAKTIKGVVKVSKQKYQAQNILIGNAVNPRVVLMAHYDAYFSGATDNASGVAVVLNLMSQMPTMLDDCLILLCGNEELSFDYPVYWGRCFREFNRMNPGLLNGAEAIYVVDSVGDGPPMTVTEADIVKLAFPIGDEPEILKKSSIITGDFDALMTVYHSAEDKPERLSPTHLNDTVTFLKEKIKKFNLLESCFGKHY